MENLKCHNHPDDDLTKEDFYWRGETRDKECKKCKCKKIKEKNQTKKKYLEVFSL